MNSGYTETLIQDKKNVILQTYMVWKIADPALFYTSIGGMETARQYLNDLLANAKNGVMGDYELSSLVSVRSEDIQLEEIEAGIQALVTSRAIGNYGIRVETMRIKRLALPNANVESVFEQMRTERQKYVTQLLSEADVGIAMGGSFTTGSVEAAGSDTAIQSADIVLTNSRLDNIPFLIGLARRTREIIRQNILIAFLSSLILIALAACGVVTALPGAILHNAGAFIILLNSARRRIQ